ncbi:MAG: hypothetical protein LKI53_07740 [Bacteroidales bacterium]|jgi:hypothetical protein|nr:hypothetical protein [Bacteroidales bacterium]
MKKILILFTLFLYTVPGFSQMGKRFWGGIELAAGHIFAKNLEGAFDASGNTVSFSQVTAGYFITLKLSLGAGIGLKGYENPKINVVPVFADIKYYPFEGKYNKILLDVQLGAPMYTAETDDFRTRFNTCISAGFTLFSSQKLQIIPAIGYDFVKYKLKGNYDPHFFGNAMSRNSIFFKIGFYY